MKIKGILERKLSDQKGTSERTGREWRRQEWLLLIPGQYSKRIKLDVRDGHCEEWDGFFENLPDKNGPVNVDFEIDAREYEGKWFNSVTAWNISVAEGW